MKILLRNILVSVCLFITLGAIIGVTYYYKTVQNNMDILKEGQVDDGEEYTANLGLHGFKTYDEFSSYGNYLAQFRILNAMIYVLEVSAELGIIAGIIYSVIGIEIKKKNKNKLKS